MDRKSNDVRNLKEEVLILSFLPLWREPLPSRTQKSRRAKKAVFACNSGGAGEAALELGSKENIKESYSLFCIGQYT